MASGKSSDPAALRTALPVRQGSLTQRVLAEKPRAPGLRERFLTFDWQRFLRNSFILCVALPVVAATIYNLLIASPSYVAEAQFAVRGAADRPLIESYLAADALAALPSPSAKRSAGGKSGGGSSSQNGMAAGARASQIATMALGAITGGVTNESFAVAEFIKSSDIVLDLDKDGWLRQRFAAGDPDWLQRLPAGASIERFVSYWHSAVTASANINTGLLTLHVTAFTADDALAIADRVVGQSEALVNRMAERGRHDRLATAESELTRQEARYLAAEAAMRDLRGQDAVIDPRQQAQASFKLLLELISARVALDVQLRMIAPSLDEDAPQVRSLRKQIAALDIEIAKAKAALTDASGNTDAASNYLAAFERAETERQLAELLYSTALDNLERTRLEAERQASYLAVFSPPALPAHASGPEVFAAIATTLISSMLLWGIFVLMVAASREHLG